MNKPVTSVIPRVLPYSKYAQDPSFPISVGQAGGPVDVAHRFHTHEFYELVFVRNGSGTQIINGIVYPMLQGDFYFMRPGEGHSYASDAELGIVNILINAVCVEDPWCSEIFKLPGIVEQFAMTVQRDSHKIALAPRHERSIDALCQRMQREFENGEAGWKLAMKSSLAEMFLIISRAWSIFGDNKAIEHLAPGPIAQAIAIIYKEYRQGLNVTELANRVHLSSNYFGELFKETCGISVQRYINKRRVDLARILLEDTKKNMTEISYEVGFEDSNYFARVFKQMCTVTPRAYRKMLIT